MSELLERRRDIPAGSSGNSERFHEYPAEKMSNTHEGSYLK